MPCAIRASSSRIGASQPTMRERRQQADGQRPARHQHDGQHHRGAPAAQVGEPAQQPAAERPEEERQRVGGQRADQRERRVLLREDLGGEEDAERRVDRPVVPLDRVADGRRHAACGPATDASRRCGDGGSCSDTATPDELESDVPGRLDQLADGLRGVATVRWSADRPSVHIIDLYKSPIFYALGLCTRSTCSATRSADASWSCSPPASRRRARSPRVVRDGVRDLPARGVPAPQGAARARLRRRPARGHPAALRGAGRATARGRRLAGRVPAVLDPAPGCAGHRAGPRSAGAPPRRTTPPRGNSP